MSVEGYLMSCMRAVQLDKDKEEYKRSAALGIAAEQISEFLPDDFPFETDVTFGYTKAYCHFPGGHDMTIDISRQVVEYVDNHDIKREFRFPLKDQEGMSHHEFKVFVGINLLNAHEKVSGDWEEDYL